MITRHMGKNETRNDTTTLHTKFHGHRRRENLITDLWNNAARSYIKIKDKTPRIYMAFEKLV